MPRTRFGWSAILLFVLIFGLFWLEESRSIGVGATGSASVEAALVGYTAPDFLLQTTANEELRLSDLRGQPLVVNFWATWCGPCRAEMPALVRLEAEHAGVARVIGVNQGESAEIITAFADELNIVYPLLLDPGNAVNRQYGVRGLPTTLFIDRDGVIRDQIVGAASEAVLAARLEALLEDEVKR